MYFFLLKYLYYWRNSIEWFQLAFVCLNNNKKTKQIEVGVHIEFESH